MENLLTLILVLSSFFCYGGIVPKPEYLRSASCSLGFFKGSVELKLDVAQQNADLLVTENGKTERFQIGGMVLSKEKGALVVTRRFQENGQTYRLILEGDVFQIRKIDYFKENTDLYDRENYTVVRTLKCSSKFQAE